MIEIEELKRVTLNKGDTLIAQIKYSIPRKHFNTIRKKLELAFPNNTVLVITDEVKLSVAGPEEIK